MHTIRYGFHFLFLICSWVQFVDPYGLVNSDNNLIEQLQAYNFTFSFWDPMNNHIIIHKTVNLIYSSAVAVAQDVCFNQYQGIRKLRTLDETAEYRCLMPILNTLRWTKLTLISQLVSQHESLPHDEEIFGLLTGYAELGLGKQQVTALLFGGQNLNSSEERNIPPLDKAFDTEEELTTCIIGIPTSYSILPALLSKGISRVIVFSDRFDGTSLDGHNQSNNSKPWEFYSANSVASAFADKAVDYFSLSDLLDDMLFAHSLDPADESMAMKGIFEGVCSIIQLNGDFMDEINNQAKKRYNSVNIQAIVNFLTADIETTDSDMRVIRTRYKTDIEDAHISTTVEEANNDGFECILSSAWHKHTKLKIADRVGKLVLDAEKKYETYFPHVNQYPDLTIVEICRIIPPANINNRNESSTELHQNKESVMILITSSMRIFGDNVFGLQYLLQNRLGYQHVYVAAEMNWPLYLELEKEARDSNAILLHIVISSVDMSIFGQRAIVYNSEQIVYSAVYEEGLQRYLFLLRDQQFALWSYDNITTHHWRHHVFPNYSLPIFEVPYCYSPKRFEMLESLFNENGMEGNQGPILKHNRPIAGELSISTLLHNRVPLHSIVSLADSTVPLFTSDQINAIHVHEENTWRNHKFALFFGSSTQRRHEISSSLELKFLEGYLLGNLDANVKFYNLFGKLVLDYTRDYFIYHSKIVINIASSEKSVFETHRINHLLSLKKVIISERGCDPVIAAAYESVVIFVNGADEIFRVVTRLLQNETDFQMQQLRVLNYYETTLFPKFVELTGLAVNASVFCS